MKKITAVVERMLSTEAFWGWEVVGAGIARPQTSGTVRFKFGPLLPIPILPTSVGGQSDRRDERGDDARTADRGARLRPAVVLLGGYFVVHGALSLAPGDWKVVLPLAVLLALAWHLASPMQGDRAISISVGMPVALASVLLLGPLGAPIVNACVGLNATRLRWYMRLFNAGMGACPRGSQRPSTWGSGASCWPRTGTSTCLGSWSCPSSPR